MAAWHGRSAGNRFGYRIFVFILRRLGVFPAYFLLGFVAFYFFLFSWKSSRHIYRYFREILHYGKFKSIAAIYRNYYLLGQTIIDKVVVMSGIKHPFTFNFDGKHHLEEMAKAGKGGILLSAHAGNYEIAGHMLNHLQTNVNLVMYDGEQREIKDYLDKVTGGRKLKVILIKNDLSHIYAISEALNKNELICMHADRFLEGNKTITGNFIGQKAPFPVGPFILAATFNVPVTFVFAFKETSTHYHLYSSTLKTYGNGSRREQIDLIFRDYRQAVEEKLKKYPLQWYNYYDFWKKES
jgi:predicted LPLAT superfamily acyltransferase